VRIMTILGSPRREGNTAEVLGWIEDQFKSERHEVDRADMLDYSVPGCGECMACKKGTVELCSIQDDANGLFRRMATSDLVLIAAPIFCWGFPAQIKGLIDRMYCMMDFEGERTDVPRLHGKPIGLLLTGGGEEADNADLVLRSFEQLVYWLKGRLAGHLFMGGCTEPEGIGEEAKVRAIGFARRLTGAERCL